MGESIPQAAMREAKEETGLTIELTRLVGLYGRSRGQEAVHNILFAAKPIAGALTPQVSEVINIGYFTLEEALNQKLLADHAQRITDALSGIGGSVAWWHDTPWPFDDTVNTRKELYNKRDQSQLSRQDFYLKHFGQVKSGEGLLEIPPQKKHNT